MNNSNRLLELENQLKSKKEELFKMKNSKLKLFLFLVVFTFILPFIPLKKGTLIEQYGYWGGVLFACVITFGIVPVVCFGVIESSQQKINELERKIEQEKLVQELFKDKKD
ncbi:hypothetical protein [Flavobacterium terrigena]|uniref:Uncharacterized protein n=1 Tax=Flavobacterium terrigena TaxID=402734 RepID=A0A1H6U699_9FLAO|nr:hypothetical protein [Flavobacterium terrigena]SEI87821.1 hypothetical protein SAMN05660918_1790 [Flavobacterium terrigena]